MSEPVVVELDLTCPEWYQNCLYGMDIYRPGLTYRQQVEIMAQWFETRYQAKLNAGMQAQVNTLVFPNQERYVECVLTWS